MKNCKLIDSNNNVVLTGDKAYLEGVKRVLESKPEDVSEQDEVIYDYELYNLEWFGELTIKT